MNKTMSMDQVMTSAAFHENAARPDGTCYRHRRNGKTRRWAKAPADFRIPVVYGLRDYGQITPANAHLFHAEDDCPGKETT